MKKLKFNLKKGECPICGRVGCGKGVCTDDSQPGIRCTNCRNTVECDENGEAI